MQPANRQGPMSNIRLPLRRLLRELAEEPAEVRQLATAVKNLAATIDELARQIDWARANQIPHLMLLDDRLVSLEHNRWLTALRNLAHFVQRLRNRFELLRVLKRKQRLEEEELYRAWLDMHEQDLQLKAESFLRTTSRQSAPRFSLIVTAGGLSEALWCSLTEQSWPQWEICVGGGPLPQCMQAALPCFQQHIVIAPEFCASPVAALNVAARLASGDYLVFARPGVRLHRHYLSGLAESLQGKLCQLLYTDEDVISACGKRRSALFKPAWSPRLLEASMYLGTVVAVQKEIFLQLDGFDEEAGDSCLHEFSLRFALHGGRGVHLPRILAHVEEPAPGLADRLPSSSETARRMIQRAIQREEDVKVEVQPSPAGFNLIRPLKAAELKLTAVICSRTPQLLRQCLTAVAKTAESQIQDLIVIAHQVPRVDLQAFAFAKNLGAKVIPYYGPFNFADMNNRALEEVETPGIVFLNDDLRPTEAGWAELLAGYLLRSRAGIVGSVLEYPDGSLQHAGLVLGIGDGVGHPARGVKDALLWPWLRAPREVSAVTGACLAITTELFRLWTASTPPSPTTTMTSTYAYERAGSVWQCSAYQPLG